MEVPDRLITLHQATEAENSALSGLLGEEWERQRTRWRNAATKSQAAITEQPRMLSSTGPPWRPR
ncbi:hypothetical protein ACH4TQ_12510 [Streptomyces sp. NPDC021218]|uniref:hypothetical protein n=1 Tax=Streptomyces sp. NPDC021218 TaxID=3365119 RepID=UPI00378B2DE8